MRISDWSSDMCSSDLIREFVRVLLLLREDFLEDALGGGVALADVVDHLEIAVDRDALGSAAWLSVIAPSPMFLRARARSVAVAVTGAAGMAERKRGV